VVGFEKSAEKDFQVQLSSRDVPASFVSSCRVTKADALCGMGLPLAGAELVPAVPGHCTRPGTLRALPLPQSMDFFDK